MCDNIVDTHPIHPIHTPSHTPYTYTSRYNDRETQSSNSDSIAYMRRGRGMYEGREGEGGGSNESEVTP